MQISQSRFESSPHFQMCHKNPLHVKILLSNMFEYFKNNPSIKKIELNRYVMDKVMEYFSQISHKSRIISNSLVSCSGDQLESFSFLYYYEGFSIRSAILMELAFEPITKNNEELIRNKFIESFEDIWDLGLFEFNENVTLNQLKTHSINSLSQIEYKFIGDPIDKLYASYFYEDLTSKGLKDNHNYSLEEMLANKFAEKVDLSVIADNIPKEVYINDPIIQIIPSSSATSDVNEIISDLDKLVTLSSKEKDHEKSKTIFYEISNKYKLDFPSSVANILELEGFYFIISDITIKGKRRFIFNLFPVESIIDNIFQIHNKCNSINKISSVQLRFE